MWEYATLATFLGHGKKPFIVWRQTDSPPEEMTVESMYPAIARAGRDGWELVSSHVSALSGETLYFKRRITE